MHARRHKVRLALLSPLALAGAFAVNAALAPAVAAAEEKLTAIGGDTSDGFGGGGMYFNLNGGPAVAKDGDVIVVGTTYDDLPGQGNQGSATVFRWNGASWIEEQTLVSSVGDSNDSFGWSVAICGPVIVVGAPFDDVSGVSEDGSATVFRWNGTSWVEEQTLVVAGAESYDGFGWSVSVSGDVIGVGAMLKDVAGNIDQGAATVFRWNGASWVEEQTLLASSGAAFDNFGCSVSVSGRTIAVGAYLDTVGGLTQSGSATVFRWNGTSWAEEQTLSPAGVAASDSFGNAVSVSGDLIVGGAPYDQVGGVSSAGSATVFRWNGASWAEEQTLTAVTPAAFDNFGVAVAVNGHTIAVGAIFDDVGANANQGSATVFRWNAASWVVDTTLIASDGLDQDGFGACVAVDGETVVVGAPQHDVGTHSSQGAVYVYDMPDPSWSDEGSALAGVFGDPLFVGAGDLSDGSLNALDLSLAAPSATAALFYGLSGGSIPFKGGFLKPSPFFLPVFLATSPSGTIPIPFLMPSGVPVGTELWVQWAILDAAAINGVSLSNAVRGLTP